MVTMKPYTVQCLMASGSPVPACGIVIIRDGAVRGSSSCSSGLAPSTANTEEAWFILNL